MGFNVPNSASFGTSASNFFPTLGFLPDLSDQANASVNPSDTASSTGSANAGQDINGAAAALGAMLSAFFTASPSQSVAGTNSASNLQVGIFCDDNGDSSGSSSSANDTTNHQGVDGQTIVDATAQSGSNPNLFVNTEQTNTENGIGANRDTRTTVEHGQVVSSSSGAGVDPSVSSLANFVDTTLNNSEKNGASRTALELQGHANAEGMLITSSGTAMSADDINQAIQQGEAKHAQKHPEDAGRGINTVVLNGCGADSATFVKALSSAGVSNVVSSSNSDFPFSQSFLPLLSHTQLNANAIAQRASQGEADPSLGSHVFQSPDVSVQQLNGGKGAAIVSTTEALKTTLGEAASNSPNQKSLIESTLDSVPSESDTATSSGNSQDKNALAVDNALIATTGISQLVKGAAQNNIDAINASTIGQANSSQDAVFTGSANEAGPSIFMPTSSQAGSMISSGDPTLNSNAWITQVFG